MTPDELKAIKDHLGLTWLRMAEILDIRGHDGLPVSLESKRRRLIHYAAGRHKMSWHTEQLIKNLERSKL